jgi:hypothetical protein
MIYSSKLKNFIHLRFAGGFLFGGERGWKAESRNEKAEMRMQKAKMEG